MPPEEIVSALIACDSEKLGQNELEGLMSVAPTREEMEGVKREHGKGLEWTAVQVHPTHHHQPCRITLPLYFI